MNDMRVLLYCVVLCVSQLSAARDSGESAVLVDFDYRTACGPIACFAAWRSLGDRATSLDDVIRFCRWNEGKTSTLKELQDALRIISGIQSRAVRLSPEKLNALLAGGNCVAILTVRRNSGEINHACCAVRSQNGEILTVDYPALAKWSSSESLAEIWDGRALVVWRSQSLRWARLCAEGTLPGFFLGLALIAFAGRIFGHRHLRAP